MTEHFVREIKVYDDSRQPKNWNELLSPSQCAVFFRSIHSLQPLLTDGTPISRFRDCTFLLFDKLEDARNFCERQVQEYPEMRCEIFDCKGMARPPLLAVTHPRVARKDELSASAIRIRLISAILLFISSVPLIWWDWHYFDGTKVVPTALGMSAIVAGIRLLFWSAGLRDRLDDQEKRIRAHLEIEKKAADTTS